MKYGWILTEPVDQGRPRLAAVAADLDRLGEEHGVLVGSLPAVFLLGG